MKRHLVPALLFCSLAAPVQASDDHGVDYCVHRLLVKAVAAMDVDVGQPFKAMFTIDRVKPLIKTCEADRRTISPIFSKTRREYTHVTVEVVGAKESRTGVMTAVPKYPHLRQY